MPASHTEGWQSFLQTGQVHPMQQGKGAAVAHAHKMQLSIHSHLPAEESCVFNTVVARGGYYALLKLCTYSILQNRRPHHFGPALPRSVCCGRVHAFYFLPDLLF